MWCQRWRGEQSIASYAYGHKTQSHTVRAALLPSDRCCAGRVVSVLEGGYNIKGGPVSVFARSVAAHVRMLSESHSQVWDNKEAEVSCVAVCVCARARTRAWRCSS